MVGFDVTVPSSPFEKGGRGGDLEGVAMRVIVDRQSPGAHGNNWQRPHHLEVSRHTECRAFRTGKRGSIPFRRGYNYSEPTELVGKIPPNTVELSLPHALAFLGSPLIHRLLGDAGR